MKLGSLLSPALAVALAALSCTKPDLPSAPQGSRPLASDGATAPPISPDVSKRGCSLAGCISTLLVRAHLTESPAELVKRGSFHLCHQAQCWDGTFTAPSAPGKFVQCQTPSSPTFAHGCSVKPERSGAQLSLGIMPVDFIDGGDFANGDRVSLRVRVGSKQAIDVERGVIYTVSSPNEPGCGPWCKGALVELWPESRSGITCSSQACDGVVRFTSALARTKDGAGAHTTLTACKNGDCKTSEARPLWLWDDAKDLPDPLAEGGATLYGIDGSNVTVTARAGATLTSPMPVTIEFQGDSSRYKNGDEYSVEWKSKTGRVLLEERRVVTYDEAEAGGPGCGPVMCKGKVFRGGEPLRDAE